MSNETTLTTASLTPTLTPSTTTIPTPSMTTYSLPTMTSWGSSSGGFGDFDLGHRVLQLVTSGSTGERIIRGFLMGVAIGIILGGALCCWVPCFGRQRQQRRARRRQRRLEAGRAVLNEQMQAGRTTRENTSGPDRSNEGQRNLSSSQRHDGVPSSGRMYIAERWDRVRRWRQ